MSPPDFTIPDRAGQRWKGRKGIATGPFTIKRRVHRTPGGELHEAEATDWRGKPFTFTCSEQVLRREYERVLV